MTQSIELPRAPGSLLLHDVGAMAPTKPGSAARASSEGPTLRARFDAQRVAFENDRFPTAAERLAALRRLDELVRSNEDAIASAIDEDFGGRARGDTFLLDILPTLDAITHARRRLKRWMRAERPWLSLLFQPASATILPQPLGVVGIIAPWNVPLLLALVPLVGALAAGNRVMIKMSEFTPRTGALIERLVRAHFDGTHVSVVNGGPDVAEEFSTLPWDHLLFTGSTSIGKRVMRAAADNLTPVTLELGGKSPVILAGDFPIDVAARRILFGKGLNAGQLCIAPDYLLAPRSRVDAFVTEAKRTVAGRYPAAPTNPDYTTVIDDRHFRRLQGYLEDAMAKGATEIPLGDDGPVDSCRMAPRLLLHVTDDMRVMQDEIFGPILPVIPYDSVDQAIAFVNARPRPLALYCFSHDASVIDRVMHQTISGGVTVNDTMVHVGPNNLPFGGVGPSGMGHYHGKFGFDAFSKLKPILRQSRLSTSELITPPYGRRFDAIRRLLSRFV